MLYVLSTEDFMVCMQYRAYLFCMHFFYHCNNIFYYVDRIIFSRQKNTVINLA